MRFLADSRRRSIALLAGGALLVFVLLGTLQWFNTSGVDFLTPATYGQTLILIALVGLFSLVLLLLLVLLFRNLLKVYVGAGSNGVAARLRSRMVLGAVMITLTPAALMFLFSYLLMNRSLERWFSPDSSQLRDDSTRVVQELVEYVASNARGEAESVAESSATDQDPQALQHVLSSRRLTLDGGFLLVYDKGMRMFASFQAPPENSQVTLRASMDGAEHLGVPLHGPLSAALLSAARRSDNPVMRVAGQEYALGMAVTGSGKIVVAALPMPQGLNETTARIRSGADAYWALFRSRNRIRTVFFLFLLLITVFDFFFSVWLALFLSKQITRPVEALADAMGEIAAGKYEQRVASVTTGEMDDLVRSFNHMAADLKPAVSWPRARRRNSPRRTWQSRSGAANWRRLSKLFPLASSRLTRQASSCSPTVPLPCSWDSKKTSLWPVKASRRCLPAECADDLAGVIRRGYRMGAASTEVEFPCSRTHHPSGHHQRAPRSRPRAGRIGAGGGRHHGTAPRAAATGVEGSGAAGGPRNQKPAYAHRPQRRAHSQTSRTRPARFAQHHPQVQ